jgi:hypothetical protein
MGDSQHHAGQLRTGCTLIPPPPWRAQGWMLEEGADFIDVRRIRPERAGRVTVRKSPHGPGDCSPAWKMGARADHRLTQRSGGAGGDRKQHIINDVRLACATIPPLPVSRRTWRATHRDAFHRDARDT